MRSCMIKAVFAQIVDFQVGTVPFSKRLFHLHTIGRKLQKAYYLFFLLSHFVHIVVI